MSGELLNEFERERDARVKRNAERMRELLGNVQLDGCAGPSGGPNTRSSTKRKRASESESDSERVKRMKEEEALDEEAKFAKLGISAFTYEDLKRRESESLQMYQDAYALLCRTKATERVTPAVLRKSQRFVDILGFERIRKVHEDAEREKQDLVRLERHMEKTGEDALGLWGACQRKGCTRPCTQWDEHQGQFYRRHRESGWCQTCHKGGEPGSDPIAQAQARAASAEALIEEFFDSYANAGYDEEAMRRWKSHVERTGENPFDVAWSQCQRKGCTRPCTRWDEDQGRFYQRHSKSGWCETCHNGGEPGSDPIAEAQARAASAEALIEEFFDSYANAGYDEEAMRRWKSHVERTGENPFDVAWSQCQREGCTRPCTQWNEDRGRFYQWHRESGWCQTCHKGGEPGSDPIAEAQSRAASAEALIEEFFDSYANAGYDEEAMRRWKSHVERTGENPFDVAWSQCQRKGCTRPCTQWNEDRGRFTRERQSGWCHTCHKGGEPGSDPIAEAQSRAASAEALIEEFFDSYANAGYDEEAMRRWKSHVERTGENPFDVAWSQCQRKGCTRKCGTRWQEDRGRFNRLYKGGWCYTCHKGGEPSYE